MARLPALACVALLLHVAARVAALQDAAATTAIAGCDGGWVTPRYTTPAVVANDAAPQPPPCPAAVALQKQGGLVCTKADGSTRQCPHAGGICCANGDFCCPQNFKCRVDNGQNVCHPVNMLKAKSEAKRDVKKAMANPKLAAAVSKLPGAAAAMRRAVKRAELKAMKSGKSLKAAIAKAVRKVAAKARRVAKRVKPKRKACGPKCKARAAQQQAFVTQSLASVIQSATMKERARAVAAAKRKSARLVRKMMRRAARAAKHAPRATRARMLKQARATARREARMLVKSAKNAGKATLNAARKTSSAIASSGGNAVKVAQGARRAVQKAKRRARKLARKAKVTARRAKRVARRLRKRRGRKPRTNRALKTLFRRR